MAARGPREFFAVRPVSEALNDFRPARRTEAEAVALEDALGRVPAAPIVAREPLPGFARATVDGYAVDASDTYGASEGLPAYLDLAGEALMGRPPELELPPGGAVAIATGPHCPGAPTRW
jgi:molybdopterin molybdotransferase